MSNPNQHLTQRARDAMFQARMYVDQNGNVQSPFPAQSIDYWMRAVAEISEALMAAEGGQKVRPPELVAH